MSVEVPAQPTINTSSSRHDDSAAFAIVAQWGTTFHCSSQETNMALNNDEKARLKHSFEKVGDHWEPKTRRGQSDDQDAKTGSAARRSSTPTAGGVNAYARRRRTAS
jgi:hypothetical protein